MDFLKYLVQKGVIDEATRDKVAGAVERSGKDISDVLAEEGIDAENVLALRSEYLQVPARGVNAKDVPPEVLKYIPEESALHYRFIPIGIEEGVLEVGMTDPDNLEARDALQFIATNIGLPFKIFLITRGDFNALLKNYHGLSGEVRKALTELGEESIDIVRPKDPAPIAATPAPDDGKKPRGAGKLLRDTEPSIASPRPPGGITAEGATSASGSIQLEELEKGVAGFSAKDEPKIVEEAPITKIVSVILRHAVDGGASDVHIEHTVEQIRDRFRVDGVLYTSLILPKTVHDSVVARIKVLSNLKLDERRKPQDGSFQLVFYERKLDFRVSTFPAY